MQSKNWYVSSSALWLAITLVTVTLASAQSAAPREKILANFSQPGGDAPSGGLIADAAGNLYGVNNAGGVGVVYLGYGTVYELSPQANGGWKRTTLYRFKGGKDGAWPAGGLVMDSSGNLYGTTQQGGTHACPDGFDTPTCGTVFELSPNGSGGWTKKTIFDFSQRDGWAPTTSLIIDSAGNLYGATNAGGNAAVGSQGGTVFELQPNGDAWTYNILRTFGGGEDGISPSGPLVFDKAGNLYGVTFAGGSAGGGTAFELINTKSGWEENVLFDFATGGSLASGMHPNGGLIFDKAGNIYGTTSEGGNDISSGDGIAFELSPASGGTWNETVLYTFEKDAYNRNNPAAGLVFDAAGNLYGTTSFGGSASNGSVFELKPSAGGTWTFSIVHSFQNSTTDGGVPDSSLLLDSKGNLFGTTIGGGSSGGGTVFEVTPE